MLNFVPNAFTKFVNYSNNNNVVRQNNNIKNTQQYNNKKVLNNNNKQKYNNVHPKINYQILPAQNQTDLGHAVVQTTPDSIAGQTNSWHKVLQLNTASSQMDSGAVSSQTSSDTLGKQIVLNKNNNKQVYNYDKATGAYILSNQNQTNSDRVAIQNNTVVQKESIYEVDPTTGRYRLTKKAKQQILNKYNARIGTQQLNNQLQNIILSVLKCNNINDLNTIIINWNNTIVNNITQNKLSKQYVKGIWEAWYNQNSKSLANKLLQLCNNNIDMYKQVSRTNIFNLDTAMKFIDAI